MECGRHRHSRDAQVRGCLSLRMQSTPDGISGFESRSLCHSTERCRSGRTGNRCPSQGEGSEGSNPSSSSGESATNRFRGSNPAPRRLGVVCKLGWGAAHGLPCAAEPRVAKPGVSLSLVVLRAWLSPPFFRNFAIRFPKAKYGLRVPAGFNASKAAVSSAAFTRARRTMLLPKSLHMALGPVPCIGSSGLVVYVPPGSHSNGADIMCRLVLPIVFGQESSSSWTSSPRVRRCRAVQRFYSPRARGWQPWVVDSARARG